MKKSTCGTTLWCRRREPESATGSASITTSGRIRAWITEHPRGCICQAARECDEPVPQAEGTFFELGALPPVPRDLSLWGQNVGKYNARTGAEDRATQGCDPSAVSSAGMAGAASAAPKSQPKRHAET